jgi:hypothetical protein
LRLPRCGSRCDRFHPQALSPSIDLLANRHGAGAMLMFD